MSSAPVQPNPPPPTPPGDTGTRESDRINIYRHSHLFYWWPVWALGFLFALITWWNDDRLALVPPHTRADTQEVEVEQEGKKHREKRDILILAKDKKHHNLDEPTILVSHYRAFGSIYVIVLLLVIVITNVSIRGLWGIFIIVSIVMLTLIFWAAGWWETIFQRLYQLSIFINMGGYLLISFVLFILWLFNFLLFDRQTYMVFTPGQVRVRQEVGGEEIVYDTAGMVVQKARNDMFRHWILGFGSGDLTIKPVGVAHPIEFPNVLWVGGKVTRIENMIKAKVIVEGEEQKPASA
jgi:hypothetical protein